MGGLPLFLHSEKILLQPTLILLGDRHTTDEKFIFNIDADAKRRDFLLNIFLELGLLIYRTDPARGPSDTWIKEGRGYTMRPEEY